MELFAYIGGKPGYDCGGFCKFCYFRSLDYKKFTSSSSSDIKIPYYKITPADQLSYEQWEKLLINDLKFGFKSPYFILKELTKDLIQLKRSGFDFNDIKVTINSWGDVIYYPHLPYLVSQIKDWGFPVHLGYTSGKGLNESRAKYLISKGVDEISFSVFSTKPELRKKWMNDKTPQDSLKSLKTFADNIDVNTSLVVIPVINDIENIYQTCIKLEDWGVNSLTLSRFANFRNQGLILNDRPVIEGIEPHSFKEFGEIVEKIDREFNFKVVGSPSYDPEKGIPFLLSKTGNKGYLKRLPTITSEATLLTSTLAGPHLKKILKFVDVENKVNTICVNNEVGALIGPEDLSELDFQVIKFKVIIPGGVRLNDKEAENILTQDGMKRKIIRGPETLFPFNFEYLDKKQLLEYEYNAFRVLIEQINS